MMINNRVIQQHINDNLDESAGNVLYKVSREFRIRDNFALKYAYELALKDKSKLYTVYTHEDIVWDMVSRTRDFMLEGLEEMATELHSKNIPFEYLLCDKTSTRLLEYIKERNIKTIVTDYTPFRDNFKWIKNLLKHTNINIIVLDSHNVIPVNILSEKEEYAASTIRKKIYTKIRDYYQESFILSEYKYNDKDEVRSITSTNNWKKMREEFRVSTISKSFESVGGEKEADKMLEDFVMHRLANYDEDRNDANISGQSDLSPYINYGMISKAHILNYILNYYKLELADVFDENKNGSGSKVSDNKNIRAFLEELIVRGELSENYCYYNTNYNNYEGLRDWTRDTLERASTDKREYIYNYEEFENAKTHDDLWNASMNELKIRGKMHGYMRMYWAKKILEWTKSPEDAINIAINLNDKYSIDGYAPSGYAGILWSIGGLHDRPWYGRPVYGLIRYMARSGCEKKFDVTKYINRWRSEDKI